jgi:phosphoserine aminotransferase
MLMNRTRSKPTRFNFGSGPSQLPEIVHEQIQAAIDEFDGSGLSILEISHRDERVLALIGSVERSLRDLLSISDDYAVLLCNFSASLQFAALPMNLISESEAIVVEVSGYWSDRAAREFERTHSVWRFQGSLDAGPSRQDSHTARERMMGSRVPGFVFHCDNETIEGIEWPFVPENRYHGIPCARVTDMSSNLLTRPFVVEDYDAIFASCQKSLGLPGMSLLIIRRDCLNDASRYCPTVMNYSEIARAGSVLNTLPVLSLYTMKVMLEWVAGEGGVAEMERRARARSRLMYSFIDQSALYKNEVPAGCRSRINIPFDLPSAPLTEKFLAGAEHRGLMQLRGHRSRGGVRASLYNAMSMAGVEALLGWMSEFEQAQAIERTE